MPKQTLEFTDANFDADVLHSDRPVLVDFWAPWCGPCNLVGPLIEQLAAKHGGAVKVGKLNIDENPQTPSRFGVSAIPTVIVFDHGEEVKRIVGARSPHEYEQAVRDAVGESVAGRS
jgi:thioredoxin 1